MSATEELRRMLDERGVEWSDASDKNVSHTTWNDMKCWFIEFQDGWTAWGTSMHGTPEQAIAATLGEVRAGSSRFELTAEQVREAIFNGSSYASFDGAKYYADGIGMQAIADELNAALGGGECEKLPQLSDSVCVVKRNGFEMEFGYWRCSECGCENFEGAKYCMNCGRKAVKR